MGHLPTRPRGGRLLLSLLWLFVLLKVGEHPPCPRLVPGRSCPRPRSDAPALQRGRDATRGAMMARPRAAPAVQPGRKLCCSSVCLLLAVLRAGKGERPGSLHSPAFTLCALLPPLVSTSNVGLLISVSPDEMRSLFLLVTTAPRCCLTLSLSPQWYVRGFVLIYFLLELYTWG